MPNTKSAAKRMRQNTKRRLRNRYFRGRARTYIKNARMAMDEGDLDSAREFTQLAISALDKAGSKGVLHKNNIARRKSRLTKQLASLDKAKTG